MCGRYAASANPGELVEEFDVELDATGEPGRSLLVHPQQPPPGRPDWNVAPSKQVPVVLTRFPRHARGHGEQDQGEEGHREQGRGEDRPEQGRGEEGHREQGRGEDSQGEQGHGENAGEDDAPRRQLRLLSWGLVPSWAKDVRIGARMANARAESVLDKPSFARAARTRRCLVPADGWYEWQRSPVVTDAKGRARKQPFFLHRADGARLAMAGLYEFWRDPEVEDPGDPSAWLTTFTIITTAADPGLDRVHDRQPLVLEPDDWARWLDPSTKDPDAIAEMLAFARPGRFTAYPITRAVNSTRNNGPHLLDPAPAGELDGVVDPETGEVLGGGPG